MASWKRRPTPSRPAMTLQRQAAAAVAAAESANVAAITRTSMLDKPWRNGPEPTWAITAISTPTPTSTRVVRRSHLDDRTVRSRIALVDADITAMPGDRCGRRPRRAHRGAIVTNAVRGTPPRRPEGRSGAREPHRTIRRTTGRGDED